MNKKQDVIFLIRYVIVGNKVKLEYSKEEGISFLEKQLSLFHSVIEIIFPLGPNFP